VASASATSHSAATGNAVTASPTFGGSGVADSDTANANAPSADNRDAGTRDQHVPARGRSAMNWIVSNLLDKTVTAEFARAACDKLPQAAHHPRLGWAG
jgi:hypothetical protein